MHWRFKAMVVGIVIAVATVGFWLLQAYDGERLSKSEAPAPTKEQVQDQMKNAPLVFQKNEGQTDDRVVYLVKNGSTTVFFTPTEIVYQVIQRDGGKALVLRQTFINGSQSAVVSGEQELKSKVNYFIGNDRSKWVSGAPTYAQVRYAGLYPGVDAVFVGTGSHMTQTYEFMPGISADILRVSVAGADALTVDDQGYLVLQTVVGAIAQQPPRASQIIDNQVIELHANYQKIDETSYGITVAGLDPHFATRIEL